MDPNTSISKGLCENEINPLSHNYYCYWASTIYWIPESKNEQHISSLKFPINVNTNKKIIIV